MGFVRFIFRTLKFPAVDRKYGHGTSAWGIDLLTLA